ncbi:MAG: D-aminoacyl-tRNA deacylase, partial [Candidatus Woesearchaeota archaeon]
MRKNIVLIVSEKDDAGLNMFAHMQPYFQKEKTVVDENSVHSYKTQYFTYFLCKIQSETVYAEDIDAALSQIIGEISIIIFCTKHASQSGKPSFCVHTQGNFGKNELGGMPNKIANCPVILKNALFREIYTKNTFSYIDVVNECTHHGPDMQTPSVFVEIGSTQKEWNQKELGYFMAQRILSVLDAYTGEDSLQSDKPCVALLGGPHTCTNINDLCGKGKIELSHACANYALLDIDEKMIIEMLEKSTRKPMVVLDYKSMN